MHGRPDYDPAGVVDLFAQKLLDWSTPNGQAEACAFATMKRRTTKQLGIGARIDATRRGAPRNDFPVDHWRPGPRVRAHGYYYWGWAHLQSVLGGGDVLADYGALKIAPTDTTSRPRWPSLPDSARWSKFATGKQKATPLAEAESSHVR